MPDHAKVRGGWTGASLLLVVLGATGLLLAGAGLVGGCTISQFSPSNPTGLVATVAMFVACGVVGIVLAAASTTAACGGADTGRVQGAAAISVAVLAVAGIPSFRLRGVYVVVVFLLLLTCEN